MTNLRVNAGIAKARRLKLVPGDGTRPMMDKAKSSLFNIIGQGIRGASFLDLFGGTGAVGIEALSRGAGRALFIDSNTLAVKTIKENLQIVGLAEKAQIFKGDALAYLKATPHAAFDFIFIAPPQYHELWAQSLKLLEAQPAWLNPDGWAVVQIDPREYKELTLTNLVLIDQRKYGNTLLCFYERPGS